jgi:hypothetical protein
VASTTLALSGSVGRWEKGAGNRQVDVETVQRLLETAAQGCKHLSWIRRGLMERLRGSQRSRTQWLRSRLLSEAFQYFDYWIN